MKTTAIINQENIIKNIKMTIDSLDNYVRTENRLKHTVNYNEHISLAAIVLTIKLGSEKQKLDKVIREENKRIENLKNHKI